MFITTVGSGEAEGILEQNTYVLQLAFEDEGGPSRVGVGAAREPVVAARAAQQVDAALAAQRVVAVLAQQHVGPGAAVDRVPVPPTRIATLTELLALPSDTVTVIVAEPVAPDTESRSCCEWRPSRQS